MSKVKAPGFRTLLAVSCAALSACEPIGSPSEQPVPIAVQSADRPAALRGPAPPVTRPIAVAEKAKIYAHAAAIDPDLIAESIEEARREPDSGRQEVLINALTERLAETDPVQALDVAVSLDQDFGLDLLAPLFSTVAKDDPDLAINALAALSDRQQLDIVHPLALLVLEEIRGDSRLIDAWLKAIPSEESLYAYSQRRQNLFELDEQGIAALAATDPDLIFSRIQTMSDLELRSSGLLYSVASALAGLDARDGLTRIEGIRDEERRITIRDQTLRIWASREPAAAMNYLASLASWDDVHDSDRNANLRSLAEGALSSGMDPGQLLALSRRILIDSDSAIRMAALEALAEQDPMAAGAELHDLPAQWQQMMTTMVASHYARLDPIAAFQWSQRQSSAAERTVLGAIAVSDPDLALDLALGGAARSRANAIGSVLVYATQADPAAAPRLARRVNQALAGSALHDGAISALAQAWLQMDQAAAMAWLAAPGIELSDSVYQAAARSLRRDHVAAAAMAARIPASARPLWIEEVAANFAVTNLEGAIDWIEQRSSDPDYARGAVAVVENLARVDAARAARLFAMLSADMDPQRFTAAAGALATSWANADPGAAAAWASGLGDEALRRRTLMNVTVAWSRQDPDAARAWILGQPAGADRDGILQSYLSGTAINGLPDAKVLDQFSSEEALGRAVSNVLGNSPSLDPEAARAWLDEIDLPAPVRQRVEDTVARIQMMREQNPEMRDSLLLLPPAP